MTSNILITGANGFIGKHLMNLNRQDVAIKVFKGDIQSFHDVYEQISSKCYDIIYHLAGLSNVADCEAKPSSAYSINVLGTFNLLESIKRSGYRTKLIFPSTAHVYAPAAEDTTIDECYPVNPGSLYSYTKLSAERVIYDYFSKWDLGNALILRLFNHTHISQNGPFFFPQLLQQIIENTSGTVKVGNLDIYRDFSLVADLMNLFLQIEKTNLTQRIETFNVCSGQTRNLKVLAEELAIALNKDISFEIDSVRFRKGEPKYVRGSNLKSKVTFNWEPRLRTDKEFIQDLLGK